MMCTHTHKLTSSRFLIHTNALGMSTETDIHTTHTHEVTLEPRVNSFTFSYAGLSRKALEWE